MKVLHLTTQDNGGAGRAAVRLHEALLDNNIDSQMIVQTKTVDLSTIHSLTQTKVDRLLSPFRVAMDQVPTLFYKNKAKDIFSSTFFPSNTKLLKKIKEINPDIVHLHWINSGFINIYDLIKFNKPILWSLHDANTYTGGCHYAEKHCKKFKTFCHSCPLLNSRFKFDLSFFNFRRKQKVYKELNLTINGLSRWISNEAKSSSLFAKKKIINLPNTIDTNIFRHIRKDIAQDLLDINKKEKIIIGFGAISATQSYRKGYLQLKEALEILPNKESYLLVIFGSSYGEQIAGIKTHFLGHIHDDLTLAITYSAFDVFIVPSLAENLSNAIMESLSCGTPVVAFDVGGNSDMITHKQNGYLAKNSFDLKNGILWCIQNQSQLANNARNSIIERFGYTIIAKKYIETYKDILNATS